ncbi:MAG: sugar kinase [Planctomycetes bacterium]|nr:sugar kinase [Planctomycetota bacterium]
MILGFGEIMMRVAPPDRRRWRQALPGSVEVTWGGGEANVCASLAMLGQRARFLTALPRHALSQSVVASLRSLDVDTSRILWREEGRLGIYFVETGANQRGATVLYDREYSAVSLARPEEYNFDAALSGVRWLHVTGITPAISEMAYRATLELVERAKKKDVTVSCDLNYRKKLWRWRPGFPAVQLARECMSLILPHVDLVIGNEEDAAYVLDIHAEGADVEEGELPAEAYEQVARQVIERFPNVSRVAFTLRESISADYNNWGAMLFDAELDGAFFAPLGKNGQYAPYAIADIVDRVGAGDSFAAGLLYAFNDGDLGDPRKAIAFAAAASALKHTIHGDFNYVTKEEVIALAAGAKSGRVQR